MIKRLFKAGYCLSFKHTALLSTALLMPISSTSFAETEPKQKAKRLFQSCASCHGQQGEGQAALGAPTLAGQLPSYLERAMAEFAAGKRGQEDHFAQQMAAMSASLQNEQQRQLLASYISTLPAKEIQIPPRSSDAAYRLYQASCGGCHGVKAEGNKALNSPRLAGMNEAYIARQLEHFRTGKRGASSRYAKQMQMMANTLKGPQDVKLLSRFIAKL
ncbi:c-type cytochrome [uncultured Pseudoteredinibacter sp.]|uniref:c-type cytochrome n=1 Tax=uncultured Pseudoteredinibacter sp. TaxID=1641701 RepID=UPI002628ADFE|nr:c-type cytochrome [uncultured Pseudoteredinibacter sp.]